MTNQLRNTLVIIALVILLFVILAFINLWLMAGVIIGLIFGGLIGGGVVSNLGSEKIAAILNTANLNTSLARDALKLLGAKKKNTFWEIRQHYKDRLSEISDENKTELEISENNSLRDQIEEAFLLIVHMQNWEKLNEKVEAEEQHRESIIQKQEEEQKILEAFYAQQKELKDDISSAHEQIAKEQNKKSQKISV